MPEKALGLSNTSRIEFVEVGEPAPFDGMLMNREVFQVYEQYRLGLQDCKEYGLGCVRDNSSNLIAVSISTLALSVLFCSLAKCKF